MGPFDPGQRAADEYWLDQQRRAQRVTPYEEPSARRPAGGGGSGGGGSGGGRGGCGLLIALLVGFWLFSKAFVWQQNLNSETDQKPDANQIEETEFVSVADALREQQAKGSPNPATDQETEVGQSSLTVPRQGKEETSDSSTTNLSGGSSISFKPHFVQCFENSIVLHNLSPPMRLRGWTFAKEKDFLDLLEKVENGTNDAVVFLVRSDGMLTFYKASNICRKRGIRNHKLLVDGEASIDLSKIDLSRITDEK